MFYNRLTSIILYQNCGFCEWYYIQSNEINALVHKKTTSSLHVIFMLEDIIPIYVSWPRYNTTRSTMTNSSNSKLINTQG